jgi:hypothetical protein
MEPENKKTQDEEEKIEQIAEELDFNKPDYIFLPKGNHIYKQSGYYLICQSCDLGHAVFIGKDKIMVGESEGQPIIKTRQELGMV